MVPGGRFFSYALLLQPGFFSIKNFLYDTYVYKFMPYFYVETLRRKKNGKSNLKKRILLDLHLLVLKENGRMVQLR